MPDLLVTATLNAKSGMPDDSVVNTFAFSMPSGFGSGGVDGEGLMAIVAAFYNQAHAYNANNYNLARYIGPQIDRAANVHKLRLYDITGKLQNAVYTKANGQEGLKPPAHGSPVNEQDFTLQAAANISPWPAEVAAVMTLRGNAWETAPIEQPDGIDPQSRVDRPRQRKTGRLYLGPIAESASMPNANSEARVGAEFRTIALKAAHSLADGARAQNGQWCIWSRQDGFLYTITHAQVDDAFDTQRRRGQDPTVRETRDVTTAYP